jgi:predicted nuclease of predicted toxin-antitoxin system
LKLLFDQNLSRKLVTRLVDIYPNSSHVQFHDLEEKTDTEIWEFSRANDFCIVTQDADFAERSRLYGSPPKVVWLRCGNAPSRQVKTLLRSGISLNDNVLLNNVFEIFEF